MSVVIPAHSSSSDVESIPAARSALALLARAASGGFITAARAAEALGAPPRAAAAKLARLAKTGWLVRARRGLYLIAPLEAIPGSATAVEDPWVLAEQLLAPCYIGGWSAAEHWALTEQIFKSTFVVTAANTRASNLSVLGAEFRVVRVPRARIGGFDRIWRGAVRVAVSDRERTIVDALLDPSWVGGVRHLSEMLVTYRRGATFDAKKLLRRAAELRRGAAFKRLGYLAETALDGESAIVAACLAARSSGTIKLDPAVASRGRLLKRWGLWVNVDVGGAAHES